MMSTKMRCGSLEIYSGVQQPSQFTTTLQIAPSDDSFMQACDVYGRCTGFNGNSGPGGVTSDLALWLRSDRGTSTQLTMRRLRRGLISRPVPRCCTNYSGVSANLSG